MSRLIVKNLPANVNAEKLKEKFSNRGDVTDIQLRFTPDGKFRKFAFIGFKTDEQAADAIKHFNNTFFNTSRIKVELCSDLGSVDKPRSWSKHTKKSNGETPVPDVNILKKREKKKDKRAVVDEELLKKVGQHKDEPHFREFLEVHSAEKVLGLCERDSGVEESDPEDKEKESEDEKPELSLAHASISDSEYLKSKMKGSRPPTKLPDEKPEEVKKLKLYTVKVKNLPKVVKKQEIKEFFKPASVVSIRKARGLLGIVYVGFKTEKDMRRALIKNKSFIKGKQLSVTECKVSADREPDVPEKWKRQESGLAGEETIGESGRIFLRNLCYTVKEEELERMFSKFGPISEINLPIDKLTRKSKGYGTVTYLFPEHAVAAYAALDGTSFQGRMLHLLPAKTKDEELSSVSTNYKKLKEARLKKTAGLSHNWNTLFLGANAVANVIAETYKASKQEVLTGKEGAVRLALGETQLVSATREFLLENGICLDAFNTPSEKRSKNIILVKNLPANTTVDEIREKFEKFGVLGRVVLPPSGIMAVVEFEEPSEARSSFTKLAYTKFKNLPLYLEWAPQNTFMDNNKKEINENTNADTNEELSVNKPGKIEASSDEEVEPEPDTTLYVKNLSFDTTEDQLQRHFETCGKLASVTISRKRDVKNPGKMLSLGYGFVQYILRSNVNKALAELQGSELSGHLLELKRSDRTTKPVSVFNRKVTNTKKQTGAKILVKNVPFQANITEIQRLFGTFGQLKFVRMPKKMAGTGRHRGFCFVEFSTKHEAKAAMKALCQSTHLYGRRLVLEWAAPDDAEIDVLRKRTAQHFHQEDVPTTKRSNKAVADFDIDEEEQDDDCNPINGQEPFSAEFPINDYEGSVREHLSSATTQQEIRAETGATVTTRGTFIHEKMKNRGNFQKTKPLYILITSFSRSSVECAIASLGKRLEQVLSTPHYQEKIKIDLDGMGPGFDIVSRLAGEGGSNFKYIGNETGASITIRGRSSGFIEPLTGRESSEPMHILLEHNESSEKIRIAYNLAYDLLQSIKEDWFLFQKQQSKSQGAVQSLYWEDGRRKDGRSEFGSDKGGEYNRDCRDDHFSKYKVGDPDKEPTRVYGGRRGLSDWTGGDVGRNENAPESYRDHRGENILKTRDRHEEDYFSGNDGRANRDRGSDSHREKDKRGWENWERSGSPSDSQKRNWSARQNDGFAQRDRIRQADPDLVSGSGRKKSRWASSSSVQDPTALEDPISGRVLEQKKEIEDRLRQLGGMKDCSPLVNSSQLPGAALQEGLNLCQITRTQLQNMSRNQLMQFSYQQQALSTENVSNNLPSTSVNPSVTSLLENFQGSLGNQLFTLQQESTSYVNERDFSFSDNKIKHKEQSYNDRERGRNKFDRSPSSPARRNSRGPTRKCTPPRSRETAGPSSRNRYDRESNINSPAADTNIPGLMDVRCSPPVRGGNERYSPQLDEGRERYSPQLEDNRRSPELFRRRGDAGFSKKGEKTKDVKNKFREMQKFRVAVIDKALNRLSQKDGNSIRSWVFKSQRSLPLDQNYNVEFIGLSSQNFVFVIMPYTRAGMKWLIDLSSFRNENKTYVLVPFDDLYNRYKIKGNISSDLLNGYNPTAQEVITELGRLNDGFNTNLWKVINFSVEKYGLFIVVSVDFLSFLQFRKLSWNPRFRNSRIVLEPLE